MAYNDKSFRDKIAAYKKTQAGVIPEVSRVALKFFRERFRRSAWQDTSTEPWKKTKDLEGENPERKRGILIKSGALVRSIRVVAKRGNMLKIATDRPYAKLHNEGGTIKKTVSVRKHTRRRFYKKEVVYVDVSKHSRKMNLTMPPRRFLGNSAFLNRYISLAIYAHFKRHLS
jgi:phage gpG-like protein